MLAEVFGAVLPESSTCEIRNLHKDLGIVFTADEKSNAIISWTLSDLLSKDNTYITLATFFGRRRKRRYIRHVLGFVVDFDTPEDTTVEDILDLYHKANLPLPELIIATATKGHYQAFNLFPEPLRCKNEILQDRIYRIHKLMANVLGADPHAVGAERWVRRPNINNIVYQDFSSSTSWAELETWYEANKPLKKPEDYLRKVIYIGTILSTPGGQRIQESLAVGPNRSNDFKGNRDEWCYGLGLCLWDAGIPTSEIKTKLFNWNQALEVPLPDFQVEKIYRSVLKGEHHASPYAIEALTGLSARIKGYYHLPKRRDRRIRDHLSEVREDIITDLLSCGVVTGSQKAWAARLGLAYRTLKLLLTKLKEEGILDANTGRGRYAQSSYSLSLAYLESINTKSYLEAAAGAEGISFTGLLKGHTAISPLQGVAALLAERPFFIVVDRLFPNDS
ncbi:primase C-terminal domain-containing protein [Desulfosporosinus sp. Sb-LF]|uniref:primase C-terminal domain-containing protein n=1 Tax=Desulfosporosinus sp. Sb-LF TaxID=2560027 RepID=UPI00107F3BCA|nr:primase C-terminal domain-containing protein [Desulfosporosinus sp. Sb-LF]TGE31130.1 DNA primase [Desulfosporosinus sp. Sb-LF]